MTRHCQKACGGATGNMGTIYKLKKILYKITAILIQNFNI